MGDFTHPNKRQRQLMERNLIKDTGYAYTVVHECDSRLVLENHVTGDEVTINKGEKTKREEQNGNQ